MDRTDSLSGPINYYRAMARETIEEGVESLLPWEDERDRTVEAPTLVLWGEQDPALEAGLADGLERWVPDVRVRRFPEASHWVHLDASGRVTDELRSFLTQ